jgi:hypothetical protein
MNPSQPPNPHVEKDKELSHAPSAKETPADEPSNAPEPTPQEPASRARSVEESATSLSEDSFQPPGKAPPRESFAPGQVLEQGRYCLIGRWLSSLL